MSKEKYQFKENKAISFFKSKNDFIEFCQATYDECKNSRHTIDFYFSYDYGKNWHNIISFKSQRQTIQNEKNIYPSMGNSSRNKKSNHDDEQTKTTEGGLSILDILGIIILLWIGLSFYNKQVGKINFINNINGRLFGWNSGFVRKGSLKEKLNEINNTATSNSRTNEYAISVDSAGSPSNHNNYNNSQSAEYLNDKIRNDCNSLEDKCLSIWTNNINNIYNRLEYLNSLPKNEQDSFEKIKIGIQALACFSEINNIEEIMKNNCYEEYENYQKAVILLILFKMGQEGLSN